MSYSNSTIFSYILHTMKKTYNYNNSWLHNPEKNIFVEMSIRKPDYDHYPTLLIEIFKSNIEGFELDNVDCIQWDVLGMEDIVFEHKFDTVLMNPPFGTKQNSGIDMKFLRIGLALAYRSVYSLHKTSTRDHIRKKAIEWKAKATVVAELKYNLPQTYKFHKRSSVDIAVDLWRFEK